MFNFGFFVSLEGCIMPLTGAIDSLTVVPLLIKCGFSNVVAYTLFGLEDGIVASLVSMPTVFATSFGASLIPNIKQQNIEKSVSNIKESIKIVWLVGLASSFVFMFFSTDIVNFLYAGGLSDKIVLEQKIVEDLLKLNSLNIIYLSLLNLSISILQGLGDSKTPVLNLGICAILRIAVILMTLPVKSINIYGTAIADMVLYSVAFILNLRAIKKKLSISYSFAELFVFPAISCTAMCLTMQLFKNVLKNLATGRTITIIMALFGVFVYVSLLFITKVLDFKKLAKMIFKKRAKAEKT
jgi:stage V sporulation protein B